MTHRYRSASKILREAKALILDRKHWTKDTMARDKNSRVVEPNDAAAVRFCAVGALMKCGSTRGPERRLLDECARLTHGRALGVSTLNDTPAKDGGGHKAVLKAFDCAIEKAEQQDGR